MAAKRFILNTMDIGQERGERMKECIDLDASLRCVAPKSRRSAWRRKAIDALCEKQERERSK